MVLFNKNGNRGLNKAVLQLAYYMQIVPDTFEWLGYGDKDTWSETKSFSDVCHRYQRPYPADGSPFRRRVCVLRTRSELHHGTVDGGWRCCLPPWDESLVLAHE